MIVFWAMFGKQNAEEVFLKEDCFQIFPTSPSNFPKLNIKLYGKVIKNKG